MSKIFRSGLIVPLILLAIPPAMGLAALVLGQDANWDLRNYHFYNPYAFLTGRMGYDIAVGQVATYYNPLLHLPFYMAVTTLPPRTVGFILGLLQGCNVFLLYAIARQVVVLDSQAKSAWFCLATALLGLLGAAGVSEIGTSYGDNVVSLLVLGSLGLIMWRRKQITSCGPLGLGFAAAAGLMAGAAFGLKLPFAVYSVGLCVAFFGLGLDWRRRFLLAFVFGLGVLTGAALTSGFWMLEMWRRFHNPIFPYFNQYFHSPWGAPAAYVNENFLPLGLSAQLFFAFIFTLHPLHVSQVPFRDVRFALLYLALLAWLLKALIGLFRRRGAGGEAAALRRFVIIFMCVSFVLWMKLFSVYRYLIVGEMLAPLALFLVLGALVTEPRRRTQLALGCFVFILVCLSPAEWSRSPWGSTYFGVQAPHIERPAETLVLTAGHEPMAYMIPFFPPAVRFLRVQSYLTGPSAHPNATDKLMQKIIAAHRGPLFLIYRSYEEKVTLDTISALGLELKRSTCRPLTPRVEPHPEEPFYFCALRQNQRP